MSKEFTIRSYRCGDEGGIIEILKTSFLEWAEREQPSEYWRWKYLDNPYGSDIYVGLDKEQIVCVEHDIRYAIKIGKNMIKAYLSDDFATHPNYRGLGITKKLSELQKKVWEANGISTSYLITTNPIVIKSQIKGGRQEFPYKISHMIKIKDVSKHININKLNNKTTLIIGFNMLKLLNKIIYVFKQRIKNSEYYKIVESTSFDGKADDLWSKVSEKYNFIIEKNRRYLNWRYCDPRGGKTVIKQIIENDELQGFIALGTKNRSGYSEGYIMDLLFHPGRWDIAEMLLSEACRYFEKQNINSINCLAIKNSQFEATSKKYGFIEVPRSTNYFISTNFDTLKEYEQVKTSTPDRISFHYGDYL